MRGEDYLGKNKKSFETSNKPQQGERFIKNREGDRATRNEVIDNSNQLTVTNTGELGVRGGDYSQSVIGSSYGLKTLKDEQEKKREIGPGSFVASRNTQSNQKTKAQRSDNLDDDEVFDF